MEEKKMQYLFGMHPVLEAVRAGKKFDKVLLKQGLEGTQFRELMELLKINEIPFQFVPGERLNRAVRGSHQGVLAYISQIDYVSACTFKASGYGSQIADIAHTVENHKQRILSTSQSIIDKLLYINVIYL